MKTNKTFFFTFNNNSTMIVLPAYTIVYVVLYMSINAYVIRRRNRVKSVSESGVTPRGGHPKSISGATTATDTNRQEANTGLSIAPPLLTRPRGISICLSVYLSDGSNPLICDSRAFACTPAVGYLRSRIT